MILSKLLPLLPLTDKLCQTLEKKNEKRYIDNQSPILVNANKLHISRLFNKERERERAVSETNVLQNKEQSTLLVGKILQ